MIIDNALSVLTDKTLSDETRTSKLGLIAGDLEAMALATDKLSSSFKKKNLWFLSIFSAGISLTANLIAASDGLDLNEKKKINKSYVVFLKSLGSDLVKEIFDAAVEKQLKRAFTEDLTTDLVEEIMTKGKFFKNASKTLTKTFGVVLSFATGVLNAIDEHKSALEKYTADGIPEDIAKHDAFIDALAIFIHDTWSGYVKGFDDWIFNFMLGFTDVETGKNYMEIIADRFKTLNYKNSGTSGDDSNEVFIESFKDKSYVYGDNGNDSIENVASNVTIWGGHDNDTIWSLKNDSKIPQKNSIFGGPGNDLIYVEDKLSTIYGGKGADSVFALGTKNLVYGDAGNDTLISVGTKNNIYGDSGNDSIILYAGATENNVTGGLGNDSIFIDPTNKKNKFFYSTGDGKDTIYCFGATDSLSISGKYSTVKSGSDFKIIVGSGSILLVDAADKKIHINNNVFNDDSESYGNFTPIEIPSLPAVPEYPLVSGTSGDDRIYNDRSNVLINAGKGNDSIKNYGGSNVTISGGNGNDTIYNKGGLRFGDSVSVFGGAGNDSIENLGSSVTIYGGEGDDYIHSSGDNVTIDGGGGNDFIENLGSSVTIYGGEGDDYIFNHYYSSSVTIDGGVGNDSIGNVEDNVTIDGGLGNDIIYNSGSQAIIDGSDGSDTIDNRSSNVTLDGGKGNDSINNLGRYGVNIDGGNGNDDIFNYDNSFSVIINGGAGNDTIDNRGESITIYGGEGNDTIYNNWNLSTGKPWKTSIGNRDYGSKVVFKYSSGDGNDVIYGFKANSTLEIGGGTGTYSTKTSGDDIIVTVGKGKITLQGAASLSAVNIDGVYKDPTLLTVTNSTKSPVTVGSAVKTIDASSRTKAVKITGNKLANTISGSSKNDSIYGGKGNDSLVGNAGNDKLFGGAGNDSIAGGVGKDTLSGDSGNDIIFGEAGNDCILGGKGNDTLWGGKGNDSLWGNAGADKFIYESGDGNDVIFGFDNKDTLTFDNIEFTTSYSKKNKAVTFKAGSGSVTLKDFTATTFHINSDVYKISGSKFKKQ